LDDTDGKTAETGLTIAASDIKLWKRGGTTESNKNSGGATHIADGRYYATLDATDTDTTGELIINVAVAGALPVRLVCCVFEPPVFDALFASGAAGYQVPIWSSANATVNLANTTIKAVTDSVAATVSDKTGYKLASDGLAAISAWSVTITGNLVGNVTGSVNSVTSVVSANVTQWNGGSLPTIGTSTLTAQQVWEYSGARTLSAFSFTVSANVTQWNGGALPTIGTSTLTAQQVWEYATRTLSAFGFTVSANVTQWNGGSLPTIGTSTLTAQQVWEYATRTLSAFGFTVAANVTQWNGGSLPTIGTSTLTAQQVWEYSTRTLSAFSFTVAANVTQWAGGSLPTIPTAGENADAVWDEAMSGHTTAGTYGGRIPRSDSSNVQIKLTGSKHIACDVHELQPAVIEAQHFAAGAIDANALAADAASEIATAVRTNLATELARIDVTVGSRLADASYTAPPSATTVADAVLTRNVSNVESVAGTTTLCTLVLAGVGKALTVGGVLNIYRTNGTTVHATKTLTTDPNADPVTGIS
jgi:hypothetical protein